MNERRSGWERRCSILTDAPYRRIAARRRGDRAGRVTTTVAQATTNELPRLDEILDACRRVKSSGVDEVLLNWMRSHGFDPARGGRLALPCGDRRFEFMWLPNYVHYSPLVRDPVLYVAPPVMWEYKYEPKYLWFGDIPWRM